MLASLGEIEDHGQEWERVGDDLTHIPADCQEYMHVCFCMDWQHPSVFRGRRVALTPCDLLVDNSVKPIRFWVGQCYSCFSVYFAREMI